jgi:hypothetical protein
MTKPSRLSSKASGQDPVPPILPVLASVAALPFLAGVVALPVLAARHGPPRGPTPQEALMRKRDTLGVTRDVVLGATELANAYSGASLSPENIARELTRYAEAGWPRTTTSILGQGFRGVANAGFFMIPQALGIVGNPITNEQPQPLPSSVPPPGRVGQRLPMPPGPRRR